MADEVNKIFDRQVLNLPSTVSFCTRCVMSNQRPRITFDQKGVCSACRYAEYKRLKVDWASRSDDFLRLLDRFRKSDGSFDVVVPCSGGKDSSTIAHRLKHEFGMNPLCVTFSPPVYSQIGWENLRRFIDSGFEHVLISPRGDIHRLLTKMCFQLFGDHNEIFDRGQMAGPFHVAVNYGIPLVIYGENGEAEYGGSSSFNELPGLPWSSFEDIYFSKGLDDLADLAMELGYIKSLKSEELHHYRLPDLDRMKNLGVEMHWFGYYHNWIPQENFYYAAENTGFRANPEGRTEGTYSKYAQLDDLTDGFLYYMMFIKYGFGRATSDAAHEIRDGHISREEGVALVKRYDGEFPGKNFQRFLDYCGLSESEFWSTVDRYRMPHIWKRDRSGWTLRSQVA